jgi:hypothetical protein
MSEHETPSLSRRIAIAVAVALVAGLIANIKLHQRWMTGETGAADFTWWWRAGHALLAGQSPYRTIDATGPYPFREGFLYPLPAAVVSVPFALLDMPTGFVAFCAVSAGVLAFSLTRDGYWRLPALMSMPMLTCMSNGQWAPLITAAALSPAFAWLAAVKPTLGGAVVAARPTPVRIALVVAFGLITVLIWPWWPREYLAELGLREKANYTTPLLLFPGPVLVAALLRWRRAEARLLFVMACAPQNLGWYDQVPLSIIPGTLRQVLVFSLLSYVPLFLVPFVRDPASTAHSYEILSRMVICACYLPCLVAVLARPNEGHAPAIVERWIRLLPQPIRARM